MAPASLLFLPMGWDRWILYLMQVGIETVLAIGQYFTALNYAVWTPGASPAFVLPVMAGGFVLLVLYDGRLRWLALAPIGAALLFIGKAEKPDLHMFGRDLIMVRSAEHGLLELRRRGRVYERQQIELFHGQEASEIACSQSCSLTLVSGARLTYHNRPNGLSASCRASDIVIMPFYEARYPCKAHLYDKSDFATYRLRQIVFRNGEWVEQKPPSNRPWHMRFADE